MREGDSNQHRGRQHSRRRYLGVLAGASLAGLGGCLGGDDAGEGDENGAGSSDRLRIHIDNTPEGSDVSEWTTEGDSSGYTWFSELSAPIDLLSTEPKLDGHTWEVTWSDDLEEASVPTMYTGYEINPPQEVIQYFNEDLTYWDGTPIDAEAKLYEDLLYAYDEGVYLNDEPSTNTVVLDQFSYQVLTEPQNEVILEGDATATQDVPTHPAYTRKYVEKFEDASTESAYQDVLDELHADSISFVDLAEEGWGSGLYRLHPEDIGESTMIARKRDDHPNEHAVIEEIEFRMADAERQAELANAGRIDLGSGTVPDRGGDFNRRTLPEYVQQVDHYEQDRGDHFLFNWKNEHLQNLWVRRAIVAAVDWHDVGANGWGQGGSIPNEHHVGMTASVAEAYLSADFLERLYTYPMENDRELAVDWLERAGYTGDPETGWTSPDGEDLVLTLDSPVSQAGWADGLLTVQSHLRQVGIEVEYQTFTRAEWQRRYEVDNVVYDMGFFWSPNSGPWLFYDANGQWWTQPIAGGDPESDWTGSVDASDYGPADNHGRPFEQEIPREVGSIEAPNQAGIQPSLADGELISIPEEIDRLQAPGSTEAEFDAALENLARYANFYLPLFTFHSYTVGYWGNVRDYSFPEAGHPANRVWKEFGNTEYLTLAGLIQHNEDGSYPEP